jgi:hypothetical protein
MNLTRRRFGELIAVTHVGVAAGCTARSEGGSQVNGTVSVINRREAAFDIELRAMNQPAEWSIGLSVPASTDRNVERGFPNDIGGVTVVIRRANESRVFYEGDVPFDRPSGEGRPRVGISILSNRITVGGGVVVSS